MMNVLSYLLLTDSPVAEVVVVAPAMEGRAVLAGDAGARDVGVTDRVRG